MSDHHDKSMRDDDTGNASDGADGDSRRNEPQQTLDPGADHAAGDGRTSPLAESPSAAPAENDDQKQEAPADDRSTEPTPRTADEAAVAALEPAAPIPGTGEEG